MMNEHKTTFQRPKVITPFSVSLRSNSIEAAAYGNIQSVSAAPADTCSCPSVTETSSSSPFSAKRSVRYICKDKEEHSKVYCNSKSRPTAIHQMDLNVGYETAVLKQNEGEKIDILLSAISLASISLLSETDIVCYRGVLTKIAASPYDSTNRFDDGWIIAAQKINNTLYLCEYPTSDAYNRIENITDKDKLMQYWGHKFETYLCASPNSTPQPDEPLDLNNEYCLMVSSKLNDLRLMFVGEVDCSFPEDRSKYVELKTSRQIENDRHFESFCRFKLYKWWLQSFLIGIEDILCGFRDDQGHIVKLQWFKVSELHRLSQHYLGSQCWDPSTCLDILSKTLRHVKEKACDTTKLYLMARTRGRINVTVTECNPEQVGQYSFLPSWFLSKV